MNTLRQAVHEYLSLRRSLGFKLQDAGKGLLEFVTFSSSFCSAGDLGIYPERSRS